MRKILYIISIVVLSFNIFACGRNIDNSDANEGGNIDENTDKYTFTDSLGEKITVERKELKNVAVLYASIAELWKLAGGEVKITVEEAVERGFADENAKIVGDGPGKVINTEVLLASKPDLVIVSTDLSGQMEIVDLLRKNNIPVAAFKEDTFEDYLNILKILTDITGNEEAYKLYGEEVSAKINEIKNKVKNEAKKSPKILLVRAYSTGAKAKVDDNFVGVMLRELGCDNIANHAKILLEELSTESIVMENPEYVFVTTMGSSSEAAVKYMKNLIDESKAWQQIDAIKNDKYFVLDKELFHYKPNARWAEAYETLAGYLYPEIYE